jgi:signal transduction histidine kinase
MSATAAKLSSRVLGWQMLFTIGTAAVVSLVPRFLLLKGEVATDATRGLLASIALGGTVAVVRNAIVLRRHRFVLRALALGSRAVEGYEMQELSEDAGRVTAGWVVPPIVALFGFATLARPGLLDLTTGISVALVGSVFVAAAALSLYVVVRAAILRAVELAPPDVLREVVESLERSGLPQRRVVRRLLIATALPVAFVTIGSALIANAHVRRADERQREETARVLARVGLDDVPGVLPEAGLGAAVEQAAALGFSARVLESAQSYSVVRDEDGIVELTTPLDEGAARVRFSGSTVGVLSWGSAAAALLAILLAALLGARLGRSLKDDLTIATRGIRLLGTEAVIGGGTRVMRPARYRDVEALGRAIERLADRFRVFARAQERAIAARERAAKMRGLFFASVSHDLKSPLNAILGFTELVRQLEPVSSEQAQSLELIERRGRELLALIETILDAARVEANQLTLVKEPITISELLADAVTKGRDLGGDPAVELVTEIAEGIPAMDLDRTRVARAIAALIGHALRSADRTFVRMRATPSRTGGVRIDIEVPSARLNARELEALLEPAHTPARGEHRGLVLGLGLARAVVELHGGSIAVADRGAKGSVLSVRLPTRET